MYWSNEGKVWEVFGNSGTCLVFFLFDSGSLDLSRTNVDTLLDLSNGLGNNVKNLLWVAGFEPTTLYVRLLDGVSEALPSLVYLEWILKLVISLNYLTLLYLETLSNMLGKTNDYS